MALRRRTARSRPCRMAIRSVRRSPSSDRCRVVTGIDTTQGCNAFLGFGGAIPSRGER